MSKLADEIQANPEAYSFRDGTELQYTTRIIDSGLKKPPYYDSVLKKRVTNRPIMKEVKYYAHVDPTAIEYPITAYYKFPSGAVHIVSVNEDGHWYGNSLGAKTPEEFERLKNSKPTHFQKSNFDIIKKT